MTLFPDWPARRSLRQFARCALLRSGEPTLSTLRVNLPRHEVLTENRCDITVLDFIVRHDSSEFAASLECRSASVCTPQRGPCSASSARRSPSLSWSRVSGHLAVVRAARLAPSRFTNGLTRKSISGLLPPGGSPRQEVLSRVAEFNNTRPPNVLKYMPVARSACVPLRVVLRVRSLIHAPVAGPTHARRRASCSSSSVE